MDKKIIKSLIDEKLEVIQEQFAIIKEYEGKIPNIELDLYMASIRDLYELVLNLQAENTGSIIPPAAPAPAPGPRFTSGIISMEPAGAEEAPEPAPPVKEPLPPPFIPEPEPPLVEPPTKPDPTHTPPPEPVYPPEPLTPPDPAPSPAPEPVPAPTPSPSPSPDGHRAEAEHASIHAIEKQPKMTVDLFSDMAGNTLADRLKDGQEKRIADKLQENMTPDLRTTIGINDKFLFINELFEGNMRVYDEAIQKLNNTATIAQVDLLLLDIKIAYNWDSDSPTVKKFVELVRRKF